MMGAIVILAELLLENETILGGSSAFYLSGQNFLVKPPCLYSEKEEI